MPSAPSGAEALPAMNPARFAAGSLDPPPPAPPQPSAEPLPVRLTLGPPSDPPSHRGQHHHQPGTPPSSPPRAHSTSPLLDRTRPISRNPSPRKWRPRRWSPSPRPPTPPRRRRRDADAARENVAPSPGTPPTTKPRALRRQKPPKARNPHLLVRTDRVERTVRVRRVRPRLFASSRLARTLTLASSIFTRGSSRGRTACPSSTTPSSISTWCSSRCSLWADTKV